MRGRLRVVRPGQWPVVFQVIASRTGWSTGLSIVVSVANYIRGRATAGIVQFIRRGERRATSIISLPLVVLQAFRFSPLGTTVLKPNLSRRGELSVNQLKCLSINYFPTWTRASVRLIFMARSSRVNTSG